jgi:hypothetical protein
MRIIIADRNFKPLFPFNWLTLTFQAVLQDVTEFADSARMLLLDAALCSIQVKHCRVFFFIRVLSIDNQANDRINLPNVFSFRFMIS